VRHILPVYPFLAILAVFGAWNLAKSNRAWAGVVALLLMFHVASSVRAFPDYIAYSNEIAGGPAGTHNLLSESNVDWGQGLKAMKSYVDQNQITECWFAYFASLGVDPAAYGIPCKPLPASVSKTLPMEIVPRMIEGVVFVSATELAGNYWGPGEMNPYAQFLEMRPGASIASSIFAFQGRFDVPLASAVTHESRAALLAQSNLFEEALAEAEMAAALAPNSVDAQVALGNALVEMKKFPEARIAFQTALSLAQSVHPEYQKSWIAPLQMALQRLPGA
jgi:tetratricopeptide (TPR) repeat protein